MEIRAASYGDADRGSELLSRSIVELCTADHRGDPDRIAGWIANKTPENWRTWVDMPAVPFFVAAEGDRLLGVGMVDLAGEILLNYVSPDSRFQGVSRALLAHMEDAARRSGVSQCRLESTRTARVFYTSAGYEPDADAAEQGERMRKVLR